MEAASEAQPEGLNKQQREAVACPGSVLVLSGAGTGKTRVIAARISRLLDGGVEPRSIFAVTFTNKAAAEMRSRVGGGAWRTGMMVCTFHSFGRQLLQAHADEAGLPPNFQILDTTEQAQLMRRVLVEDMNLTPKAKGGPDPRELARLVSRLKEAGMRSDDARLGEWQLKQQERMIYERFERLLAEEGKADFPELLLRTYELLRDREGVRRRWQGRFGHILIDELQDINIQQLEILRLLRREGTVFFGVGDDDQSIYRFRGAVPRMLDSFAKEFAGGNVLRLEENYRSSAAILALANEVISKNRGRLGKTLRGTLGSGSLPELTRYPDDMEEAATVSRRISDLIDEGASPSGIAVLYRNHALSQLLEAELSKRGVPFHLRGGQRFFARAEVKDAVAYMRLAAWPDDFDALERSIRAPSRKVGPKRLDELRAAAAGSSLDEALRGAGSAAISEYHAVIEAIREAAARRDLTECARLAAVDSGLVEHLRGRHEEERAENLGELVSVASRFEELASDDDGLVEFLNSITLDDGSEQEGDKVSLMTIHAAKGLEFERIFLIGLEEGILPGGRGKQDRDSLEEERRLLYVAITRAKSELEMSLAARRRRFGQLDFMEVSSLLRGVDQELFELQGMSGSELRGSAPASRRSSGAPWESGRWGSRPKGGSGSRRPPPSDGKQSLGGYHVGQKVSSGKFGGGVILALAGSGEKAKAKVLFFRDRKQRWLLLAMAGLTGAEG